MPKTNGRLLDKNISPVASILHSVFPDMRNSLSREMQQNLKGYHILFVLIYNIYLTHGILIGSHGQKANLSFSG